MGRDIEALDQILKVPIWIERKKVGVRPEYLLPRIYFRPAEAMVIFIATRLLLSYSNAYNPDISSAFTQLNSIVPPPLRAQIEKTLVWMQQLKKDEQFIRTMNRLTTAWIEGRRVKIKYHTLGEKTAKERVIEPYFIQPAALEHGNYVMAYCHLKKEIRTFKVERIRSIELLDERYTVPESFDANKYLGTALGISVYGEAEKIKLKFNPVIGRLPTETIWHPTQKVQMELDGSAIVTLNVPVTEQLETFILGWGEKVEVMQPAKLRKRIAKIARATARIYKKKKV